VRAKKGLTEKENLMDRAGPLELSANDFQMELAAQVIERENVHGEQQAIRRNEAVARRVRDVIKDSGGTLPEDLPLEPVPIKVIEARIKKVKKFGDPKPDEPTT
jgi:DNA-damage-inducible protein D